MKSPVIWLTGIPGSGKTTLAITVLLKRVEEDKRQNTNNVRLSSEIRRANAHHKTASGSFAACEEQIVRTPRHAKPSVPAVLFSTSSEKTLAARLSGQLLALFARTTLRINSSYRSRQATGSVTSRELNPSSVVMEAGS